MVLIFFSNTIAKPQVKRVRDIFYDEMVLIFCMNKIAKPHVKRLTECDPVPSPEQTK